MNLKNTLIELCKYYMEFLESDFKSNRLPSRRINLETENIKKIVLLNSYKGLNTTIINTFNNKFETIPTKIKSITKNKFISKIESVSY